MGLLTDRIGHLFDASGSLTDEGRLVAAVVYVLVVLIALRRGKKFLINAFPSNVREYVPYRHDARGTDTVCVDCTHPRLPTLTHHKESSTPAHLKGDTSTDVVMNALTDPAGWQPMRAASKVTCNHFDIDGVLSVWACINPIAARKHETLMRTAARLGDFREMAFEPDGEIAAGSVAAAALKKLPRARPLSTLKRSVRNLAGAGKGDREVVAAMLAEVEWVMHTAVEQTLEAMCEHELEPDANAVRRPPEQHWRRAKHVMGLALGRGNALQNVELVERGVPQADVNKAANKFALKEIASKYDCKITFVD